MQASDFKPLVSECCAGVLDSMYFTTVLESSSQLDQLPAVEAGELAFSLHFKGDISGRFGICLEEAMACMLAANFLGEPEESLGAIEIAEVVGELTNMLCGSIVSRVEGSSKFALSHPEPVLAGQQSAEVLLTRLETDSGVLFTWIAMDLAPSDLNPAQLGTDGDEIKQAAH